MLLTLSFVDFNTVVMIKYELCTVTKDIGLDDVNY